MQQQKQIFSDDYENFLNPEILAKFREANFKQSVAMIKDLTNRKVWQPDKFHISKKSEVMDISGPGN
jgi:hypothetical protein